MSINPYKPPGSDSSRNPEPPAGPRSLLGAVTLGLVVDVGGSLAVGMVLTGVYAAQLRSRGVPDAELAAAVRAMPHDSAMYVAALLVAIGLSVLGGYVCARAARRDEYRPGLMMAVTSALFGMTVDSLSGEFTDMTLLLALTGFACNLLGVKYGAQHNRRAEAASP